MEKMVSKSLKIEEKNQHKKEDPTGLRQNRDRLAPCRVGVGVQCPGIDLYLLKNFLVEKVFLNRKRRFKTLVSRLVSPSVEVRNKLGRKVQEDASKRLPDYSSSIGKWRRQEEKTRKN